MVLEDAISSHDSTNLMANHGKDIKHAKKLVKKMKLKLLSYKAEKAKLKQKVSELNLKLVTKESTITNLEKNCDTLTDKCNKGMMQLIEAKEENKNLSLRVLEQIKTIAKLEGSGSQNGDLGELRSENKELTKQIEESKATIVQLTKQLSAAKEASKSAEKAPRSQVEEVNRLKEELVEKDKLMQTYRSTHKELVGKLQVEAIKTKELLQEKTEELDKSASTIANLTQEKKDLFEAVRKSSQMAGKVKALQKEIADLKAKEAASAAAAAKEKEDLQAAALVNGTVLARTQSSPAGTAAPGPGAPDLQSLSARDPRKRQKGASGGGIDSQIESLQNQSGLTLTL